MVRKFGYFIAALCILLSTSVTAFAQAVQPTGAHGMFGRTSQAAGRKYHADTLHFKLRAGGGLSLQHGSFVGGNASETAKLNAILAAAKRTSVDKLATITASAGTPAQVRTAAAVQDYYKAVFAPNADVVGIAAQLENLTQTIESAYPEAAVAPAPTVPLYQTLQNYLQPAGIGVDTAYAKTFPGGKGGKVRLIDIEYSWNTAHADLAKAQAALLPNGTPVDPYGDNNHGTAVLGEMVGTNNTFGVTGVSPAAGLTLINANNAEHGFDPAGALVKAASVAQPGDVVIIEQQTWGPADNPDAYLPIEWIPEVYDAIRALTASGIIVVEPAANGGQNLGNVDGSGLQFPMGKPDSGAIIVGAGENCADAGPHLSRMYMSNYGSRVNLQGPGDCVVTTGYGDLYGAAGINNFYTARFNSTSSAAPVVAAAAADLSSVYKTLNGRLLTPLQVRTMLQQTGTAQTAGTYAGAIGPLPNLAKALPLADLTAPTVPQLDGHVTAAQHVVLSWSLSADNVTVAGYQIYRNGVLYKQIAGTQFTNIAVSPGATYTYKVRAIDEAGNVSAFSNAVRAVIK